MASREGDTVWHAFYNLLRSYDMRTMFGNPGSTEQPMLKNFPSDFEYILALQEASVVAMADGFSQATRKPVVVSLHTSGGYKGTRASICAIPPDASHSPTPDTSGRPPEWNAGAIGRIAGLA